VRPSIGKRASSFLQHYPGRVDALERFAEIALGRVRAVIDARGLEIHNVSARAKSTSSAMAKVRRKRYGDPWQQLTDQVGIRIIVYYESDVDSAAIARSKTIRIQIRASACSLS
jgi:ppGpp synthetase/RelA/SpoT-type nucleotidyltranferase